METKLKIEIELSVETKKTFEETKKAAYCMLQPFLEQFVGMEDAFNGITEKDFDISVQSTEPYVNKDGRLEFGSLSFKPHGNVTSDVIAYVCDNIDDFEVGYKSAINKYDRWTCELREADSDFYDKIVDCVFDYIEDNKINYNESELWDDIDVVFN